MVSASVVVAVALLASDDVAPVFNFSPYVYLISILVLLQTISPLTYLDFLGFVVNSSNLSKCLVGKFMYLLTSRSLKGSLSLSLSSLSSSLNLFLDLVLLINTNSLIPNTILVIKLLDYCDKYISTL